MQWHNRICKWQSNNTNEQGGLEKRKAEQDRLIFILSTRNEHIQQFVTDYDITVRAGIDSS